MHTLHESIPIDNIIDEQKRYQDDLKITFVDNASKSIFDKEIVSLFNVDHKYFESSEINNKITKYVPELVGYNTFNTFCIVCVSGID